MDVDEFKNLFVRKLFRVVGKGLSFRLEDKKRRETFDLVLLDEGFLGVSYQSKLEGRLRGVRVFRILTANCSDRALNTKGVPFLELVNKKTLGSITSSDTKVLWLLELISIAWLVMNWPALALSTFWSSFSVTSRSIEGTGKGGIILTVGKTVTFSFSQIYACSSQSTAPILKMPLLSVEKAEKVLLKSADLPSGRR